MAAPWRDPRGIRSPSLLRRLGTLSAGGPSTWLNSEKRHQSGWSLFSSGQRAKSTLNRGSSHLLQQLIRRSQDEEQGEGESEESSKSEMLNLEVRLFPCLLHSRSLFQLSGHTAWLPAAPQPAPAEKAWAPALFLKTSRPLCFSANSPSHRFLYFMP